MNLNAMALFNQVVTSGSFTAAAAAYGLPKSTVSHRIAVLEAELGVRLLNRTTRQLSLTAAGQVYFDYCRSLVEVAEAANAAISRLSTEPHGHLRIAAPVASGTRILSNVIAGFNQRYPQISVETLLSDISIDMVSERIDLALRTGRLSDSSLVSRQLGNVRRVLVATPAYLKDRVVPTSVADLSLHHLLRHDTLPVWKLRHEGDVVSVGLDKAVLSSNNLNMLVGLALAGRGIALLPFFTVRDELLNGKLVEVLPDCPPVDNHFYAIYSSRSHRPAALLMLLDYLNECDWHELFNG